MDKQYQAIMKRVWRHSGITGYVWTPHIHHIGRPTEKFIDGGHHRVVSFTPKITSGDDWYWTPAVATEPTRRRHGFGPQRVVWVDCDDNFNDDLLMQLKPSYVWETSPGHKQAIWLLKDQISSGEFHRDRLMGVLAHAIGADRSGVDVGQLLRIPGSIHHKKKAFRGKILVSHGKPVSSGSLIARISHYLGLSRDMSMVMGRNNPTGDRSKILWKLARSFAELGVEQELAFKLLNSCKWNKWRESPDRLRDDVAKAYRSSGRQTTPATAAQPLSGPGSPREPRRVANKAAFSYTEDGWPARYGMAYPPEMSWRDIRFPPDVVRAINSEVLDWDQMGEISQTPMRWVVPGLIPEGGCGMLVAPPKVGKTRLSLELALGISTGTNALGIEIPRSLPVGLFALEDGKPLLMSRLDHMLSKDDHRQRYNWRGYITPDLVWHPPKKTKLKISFSPMNLSVQLDKTRLRKIIQENRLKLAIIDTLSMAIGGADVNNSADMYSVLSDVKEVATETKCAIIFVHHTRKSVTGKIESMQDRILGSTALHAWCDFIISLQSPTKDRPTLRMDVQSKTGSGTFYLDDDMKICPSYDEESEQAHTSVSLKGLRSSGWKDSD